MKLWERIHSTKNATHETCITIIYCNYVFIQIPK